MKIGTIIKLVGASFLVIIAAFIFLTVSIANQKHALSMQADFKQLGLDLSGASDFLTEQARAYVQYGEKKYYEAYMYEVEVAQNRGRVVAELTRLGAPQGELSLVEKAAQLSNTLAELETRAFEAVDAGDLELARRLMFGPEYEAGKVPIVETMRQFQDSMARRTNQAAESAKEQENIMLVVFSVLFAATALLILLSLVSIHKKMNMIGFLSECAVTLASGNNDIAIDVRSKDEVGILAQAFGKIVSTIQDQVEIAERIANGDLTVEPNIHSQDDAMGHALQKMISSLNSMFGDINASSAQVSAGAKQIADGSQSLAQGSALQSSSIEQLSSSTHEISKKTKINAEMAGKAAALAGAIKQNAEKGSRQMNEMTAAVRDINTSSQSIQKVIKVIDDIAFQTNILALNAAVEAARAGQHGKGFAVVAEEVRNLAAKSAEAAKDTGSLIADSMEKAALGSRIADETAASLAEIVAGINESSQIVNEIAHSSDEQSAGIAQINQGIDQVAQVIQQNSATAEESAAASQEMSGQSDILEELIARFTLKDGKMGLPAPRMEKRGR